MNKIKIIISIFVIFSLANCKVKDSGEKNIQPIKISSVYPKYFETATGEAWIPIMTNYLPFSVDRDNEDDTAEFILVEDYFKKFSENGGNSMRIWISTAFLEIEDEEEGKYNPLKFERIDKLLALAEKYDIKIKFTLHHIRSIVANLERGAGWSNSKALATKFENINEYVSTPKGINSYLNRARALAEKYKDNTQIFAWELWNEMDAVPGDSWSAFTKDVLDSVKAIFPNHLVVQTLGSLHSYIAEESYKTFFSYNNNEFASIHRYLELGDDWGQYSFIKGDVDTLVYSAMRFAQNYIKDRPIVMNEIGAVEPNHAGPFKLYKVDTEGVLMHDMVFAPFFCGSAGSGAMWHWDSYVYANNLWFHFKRFKNAIDGIDPIKEKFENFTFETDGVRGYGLKGETTTIIWCRDTNNNWRTELEQGITPEPKEGLVINQEQIFNKKYSTVRIYDPWQDSWTSVTSENNLIEIPTFVRSTVIVLQ